MVGVARVAGGPGPPGQPAGGSDRGRGPGGRRGSRGGSGSGCGSRGGCGSGCGSSVLRCLDHDGKREGAIRLYRGEGARHRAGVRYGDVTKRHTDKFTGHGGVVSLGPSARRRVRHSCDAVGHDTADHRVRCAHRRDRGKGMRCARPRHDARLSDTSGVAIGTAHDLPRPAARLGEGCRPGRGRREHVNPEGAACVGRTTTGQVRRFRPSRRRVDGLVCGGHCDHGDLDVTAGHTSGGGHGECGR